MDLAACNPANLGFQLIPALRFDTPTVTILGLTPQTSPTDFNQEHA